MADGRIKIGSRFLKVGSLYVRIGPAPAGDHFYANLRFGMSDYSVSANTWTALPMDADFSQFYDTYVFARDSDIFAAGQNISSGADVLWESGDAGQTWTQHAIPSFPFATFNWTSIWVDASGRIWGLFDSAQLFRSDDRGVTWSLIYSTAGSVQTTFPYSLVGHPTNPDKFALFGGSGTDQSLSVAVTKDSWATWNVALIADVFPDFIDDIRVTWLGDDTLTTLFNTSVGGPPFAGMYSRDDDHLVWNPVTGLPATGHANDGVVIDPVAWFDIDDNDIAESRVLGGDGGANTSFPVDVNFQFWLGAFNGDLYLGDTSANVDRIIDPDNLSFSPFAVASPGGNLRGFSRTY